MPEEKKDEFESFINKVGGYEEAIRQEHEVIESDNTPDTVRKLIETKIARALPGFVDDLILIARTGDSDTARLKAISFAFNWYFKESTSADDPFSKLLTELTEPKNQDENPHLRDSTP
ncbi:MAG TPA: hypothetical protein VGE97_09360 [Nitrososphaera sp.]|jgi:hypothetical protein